jgi:hypothetical protein
VRKAKWSVTQSSNGAVTVYAGRQGLAVVETAILKLTVTIIPELDPNNCDRPS